MKNINEQPRESDNRGWRGLLFLILFLLFATAEIFASVLVAPTIVIMSDKNRTGRMILQNPTDKPKEISVGFAFGIPVSDSLGNITVPIIDSMITDPHSATDWVKAFPRKIILQPGAQQTVRFVASPPKDLEDGEYWARIMIRSQESKVNKPQVGNNEGITTSINMIMQTAIALKFRKGKMVSELELTGGTANIVDSQVQVVVDIENKGNVSYLGVMHGKLVDATGKEISTIQTDIAIYYDTRRRMVLPIKDGDFKKPYQVEMFITSEGRKDISPENRINGNTIRYSSILE